jgi:hypothetical protein
VNEIIRAFEAQIDSVLEGERAVVARINTSTVDRYKTVIDPLGADISHFNKTRSVLWEHGSDPIQRKVPIGQGWVKIRRSEGDLIGKCKFDDDEFPRTLFEKYKSGSLNGWSIKAAVHDASPPTIDEIRSRPDLEDCEIIYRKWDLVEFSATHAAGNSDCISLLVSRGMIMPPEGFVMPEPKSEYGPKHVLNGSSSTGTCEPGTCLACDQNRAVDLSRRIECDGSYWHVMDGGKKIASFADVQDAEELMRAMDRTRSFEQVMVDLHTQQQAKFTEMEERIIGLIELKKFGRI